MKIIIGKKIGMTQLFMEKGKVSPVTVLDVSNNIVSKIIKNKTGEVTHIEIAKDKKKKPLKVELGNYKNLGYVPKFRKVFKKGFFSEDLKEGDSIPVESFGKDEKIKITGVTKGKGFAGVVKRYGMKGGPRTHGQSDRERAIGAIGARMTPGRVFKGHRMPGHMGNVQKTLKNMRIIDVDQENKLIMVKGSVFGKKGSFLVIKSQK